MRPTADTIEFFNYSDARFEDPEAFTDELVHIIQTGSMTTPLPRSKPLPEHLWNADLKYWPQRHTRTMPKVSAAE